VELIHVRSPFSEWSTKSYDALGKPKVLLDNGRFRDSRSASPIRSRRRSRSCARKQRLTFGRRMVSATFKMWVTYSATHESQRSIKTPAFNETP
jgi:hypothetical protein